MLYSYQIDQIDQKEMLRYLGYSGQELDTQLMQQIDDACARVLAVSAPKAVVEYYDVETSFAPVQEALKPQDAPVLTQDKMLQQKKATSQQLSDTPQVKLAGTSVVLKGKAITRHVSHAQKVALLAVTLGMKNEQELRRLSLTNPTQQILFDAASTTLVEQAADLTEAHIIQDAQAQHLATRFRFSPGYGDLPMDTQPQLLATLNTQRLLGLFLTPTQLMTPTKSVSAIVPLVDPAYISQGHQKRGTCVGCRSYDSCKIRASGKTCYAR